MISTIGLLACFAISGFFRILSTNRQMREMTVVGSPNIRHFANRRAAATLIRLTVPVVRKRRLPRDAAIQDVVDRRGKL